jgi:hypothetical protein
MNIREYAMPLPHPKITRLDYRRQPFAPNSSICQAFAPDSTQHPIAHPSCPVGCRANNGTSVMSSPLDSVLDCLNHVDIKVGAELETFLDALLVLPPPFGPVDKLAPDVLPKLSSYRAL